LTEEELVAVQGFEPGHCGYEPEKADSKGSDITEENKDNQEVAKRK
jgi:hypothetical protein